MPGASSVRRSGRETQDELMFNAAASPSIVAKRPASIIRSHRHANGQHLCGAYHEAALGASAGGAVRSCQMSPGSGQLPVQSAGAAYFVRRLNSFPAPAFVVSTRRPHQARTRAAADPSRFLPEGTSGGTAPNSSITSARNFLAFAREHQ